MRNKYNKIIYTLTQCPDCVKGRIKELVKNISAGRLDICSTVQDNQRCYDVYWQQDLRFKQKILSG